MENHIQLFEVFKNNKLITVYHGDNFGTTKIDPINMDLKGNLQEGVGIYFTDNLETAQYYGAHIVTANIRPDRFIDSRGYIGDYLETKQMIEMFKNLWKIDPEQMYYLISNYVEIWEPADITERHLTMLAKEMKTEEVRNFQITLGRAFEIKNFVESWNSNIKNIDGTMNSDLGFYCIINPKIELNIYSM